MEQHLLSPDEFVRRIVGTPWCRWRADWEAVDCYGLIVLWHREVLSLDLGPVPQCDIAEGFASATGWTECELQAGATCFMAWREGAPTHCGVVLDGARVLHAEGSVDHPGNVRVSRLSAVERVYGALRFYRYAAC
ncbi:NlpC/P60 family protein [Aquincola tertiaricarbonis]|uniref:NlpC/P60 family protein n=1 Tax=Aquincola tertiaricarbonis TaxID=391953 RepID=A0ABY4S9A5_AQUTE|nr:NlpC/P60 family protein [Aquincola tertiaricarbonis]URI08775.1 NlpC/P60 family protein [Aquincola tertiaricarbonis]